MDTSVTKIQRPASLWRLFVLLAALLIPGCAILWIPGVGSSHPPAPEPPPDVPDVQVLTDQLTPPLPVVDLMVFAAVPLPADTVLLPVEERLAYLDDIHAVVIGQGVASFYGRLFAGRPTASGERFNPEALTAAHRTLPFGSRVRVTNLDNDRSVVVRINDRGPFIYRRLIDVSRAAANELDFIREGVATVKLELLPER